MWRQDSCSRRAFPTTWMPLEARTLRGETEGCAYRVPNDESERRAVAPARNEAALYHSSTDSLAHRKCYPLDRSEPMFRRPPRLIQTISQFHSRLDPE